MSRTFKVTASAANIRSGPGTKYPVTATVPVGTRMMEVPPDPSWPRIRTFDGVEGHINIRLVDEVPASASAPPKGYPPVPHGRGEVEKVFGAPGSPDCEAGRVHLPAPLHLSWEPKKTIQVFACHRLMVPVFQAVFDEIHADGLWGALHDFGGCYNNRSIRGSTSVSTHAWAIAVDLDVAHNPLGATPKMDPRIIRIFEKHGFVWGGRFSRKDGMHFQYATGI